MTLSDAERERFATYLEQSAADTEQLVAMLGELPGSEPKMKQYQAELMAEKIVAAKLRSVEFQAVG